METKMDDKTKAKANPFGTSDSNGQGGLPDKDERDIVVFFNNEYYFLPFEEWSKARTLSKGERSILVPLINNGTLLADVNHPEPKFGTWTNLLNLTALLRGAEPAAGGSGGDGGTAKRK
jgi:hypothetical protein